MTDTDVSDENPTDPMGKSSAKRMEIVIAAS